MPDETKYEKLQDLLKAELSSGKFRTGDRFYTEREIMEKYSVSGITVARALNEMTKKGYFKRKRKLGTFVLESPEMPGMTGCVMTRPLFINRATHEESDETRNGPSWFVVEEIRRGVINSYPGAVKIVDMGPGNQTVQIHSSHIIFRQNNNMIGRQLLDAFLVQLT